MDQDILEEGELSNDSDEAYTPLERPVGYSAAAQPLARFPDSIQESESELELQSSDSDSDSDNQLGKTKKAKMKKLKPKLQLKPQHPTRKKYDIWSTRVQEDVLSETLNCCDVTIKDRSRDVESYDYLTNPYEISERKNNKRSRDDRGNPNLRQVGRSKSKEKSKLGTSRVITDINVTIQSSSEEIAKDIANKLCEEKEDLILRVIDTLGKEKAFLIFRETKRIEEEGGMLIMNQTRRRTPGGVFLFLVRHDYDITPEQKNKIFQDEREKTRIQIKNKQKKKMKKLRAEIIASKSKLLPELLTRAELLINPHKRNLEETDERDVVNPPPTPETDGGHDNSGDGMDSNDLDGRKKLEAYDEDFLDLGGAADMDLF